MRLSSSYSFAVNCRPQQRHATCACCGLRPTRTDTLGPRVKKRTKQKLTRLRITAGDVDNLRSAADDVLYLMQECGAVGSVIAGQGKHGLGLFTTHGVSKGETLMQVPESACLVVDYVQGIQLPDHAWPRLRKGLQGEEALPWDILLGLALLDALNGDGGAFWEEYAERMLPQPASLTVPFCLQPSLLRELQHQDIISGATKQQDRLAGLFPGLATPMGNDSPTTYMQWGLACVRSRAFQLGKDRFAFVPFLDMANHSPTPNAAFRASETAAAIELVAVDEIDPGQEAVISYTERAGTTNMRMMQQYGFVLTGGNPADRVTLPYTQAARDAQPALSIQHLERILGDRAFVDMMGGRQPRLVAAMKSLPLREDDTPAISTPAERDLVALLSHECNAQLEACASSIEEDIAACEAASANNDSKMQMVIQYRMERKMLLKKTRKVLNMYCGQACNNI